MKNIIMILTSVQYPGYGAASNRISMYIKGIEKCDVSVHVRSTHRDCKGGNNYIFRLKSFYFDIPYNIIKSHKNIKDVRVIIVYGYGWFHLILIKLISVINNKKIILEINEKPYTPYSNWLLDSAFIKRVNVLLYSRVLMRLMDGFIVISDNLEQYVLRYKNKKAKVIIVPILADLDKFDDINRNTVDIDHIQTPYILHAGALSERKDGIVDVLRALAIVIRNANIDLHIYFTDNLAPQDVLRDIESVITQYDLGEYVHYLGQISEALLNQYKVGCSMLVLNKPINEQNKHNFATKITDYLVLSKPVIYTPVGEMSKYFIDGVNGYMISGGDCSELANKIVYVLENNDAASRVGSEGKKIAENHFDYKTQGVRIVKFIGKVINLQIV